MKQMPNCPEKVSYNKQKTGSSIKTKEDQEVASSISGHLS